MTERKPSDISFTSWVDQQINEAAERGAFDNLPGAGKPIPRGEEADDGQAWLRDYLRREGVPTEGLLPAPLKLRKEIERLTQTVRILRSEQDVDGGVDSGAVDDMSFSSRARDGPLMPQARSGRSVLGDGS